MVFWLKLEDEICWGQVWSIRT